MGAAGTRTEEKLWNLLLGRKLSSNLASPNEYHDLPPYFLGWCYNGCERRKNYLKKRLQCCVKNQV